MRYLEGVSPYDYFDEESIYFITVGQRSFAETPF